MGSLPPLLTFLLMVMSSWVHRRHLIVIEFLHAERSGSAKLNSAISGNSGNKAGPRSVWQEGVSDGEEEGIGAAHSAHPQPDVQGARGVGSVARRSHHGRAVRTVRTASEPDRRVEAPAARARGGGL